MEREKKKISYFLEKTQNFKPHQNIQKLLEIRKEPGTAIDLGCGAGRDTVFLLQHGWKVIAIDQEDTKEIIEKRLNRMEKKRFLFEKQQFEKISLPNVEAVIANYSLPFCDKRCFLEVWEKIEKAIKKEGYFAGNFFGVNDSWRKVKQNMTFLTKEEVEQLFSDFSIMQWKEREEDGVTAIGEQKHWHIYEVIAKKR